MCGLSIVLNIKNSIVHVVRVWQALRTFADEWMEIARDPDGNKDLQWKYGIDDDVLDRNIRQVEPANWVRYVCDLSLLKQT